MQKRLEKDLFRRSAAATTLANDSPRARGRPSVAAGFALAAVLLPLTGSAAFAIWDAQLRTRVEYYAHLVRRWGAAEGVGRLTEQQAQKRQQTWRFYFRGDKVQKVESVNGSGSLTTEHWQAAVIRQPGAPGLRRECRYVYRRNSQGEVVEEIAQDRIGQVVWTFHFSTKKSGHYTDARGAPGPRNGSGATFVELAYTDAGFEQEVLYQDKAGRPRADANGTSGERREVDERGLVVVLTLLGPDGKQLRHPRGYTQLKRRYDAGGNCLEEAYFDERGRPARHQSGYAKVRFGYDAHGNCTSWAYLDEAGRPVQHVDGSHRWAAHYDERGNCVEETFRDAQGRPVRGKQGYARLSQRHDARGNCIEAAYFDERGVPVRLAEGYAKVTQRFDEYGNYLEAAYFDERGEPTRHRDGYSKLRLGYDGRGLCNDWTYLDERGRPLRLKEGFARVTAKHDERGNAVEVAYFDEEGRPARHRAGYSHWRKEYDAGGRLAAATYLGYQASTGFTRVVRRYDERGLPTEVAYLDDDGKPGRHQEGFARWKARYDARGRLAELALLDERGRPIQSRDGYARWTIQYDDRDRRVDVAFFDAADQPVSTRLVVLEVPPGSPAERVGLKSGDLLVRFAGKEVVNSVRLWAVREAEAKQNQFEELQVLRAGSAVGFAVTADVFADVQLRDRVVPDAPAAGDAAP